MNELLEHMLVKFGSKVLFVNCNDRCVCVCMCMAARQLVVVIGCSFLQARDAMIAYEIPPSC